MKSTQTEASIIVIIVIAALFFGFLAGQDATNTSWERWAVEEGYARYHPTKKFELQWYKPSNKLREENNDE